MVCMSVRPGIIVCWWWRKPGRRAEHGIIKCSSTRQRVIQEVQSRIDDRWEGGWTHQTKIEGSKYAPPSIHGYGPPGAHSLVNAFCPSFVLCRGQPAVPEFSDRSAGVWITRDRLRYRLPL